MNTSNRKIFGTDGIRGKVGEDLLTPDFMQEVGRAIGTVFGNNKKNIVIARDTRVSGDMLQAAISSGICSTGTSVIDLGVMTTPACAYLTKYLDAAAGIVISASHNPYYDNGVKIFSSEGSKLTDEQEHSLENVLFTNQAQDQQKIISPNRIGRIINNNAFYSNYIDYCCQIFNKSIATQNRGLKIVVDCSNGGSFKMAPEILTKLGFNPVIINNEPNGFNINQDCGAACEKGLETLAKSVKKHSADLGISFDGDGDRLILVSSTGEVIDGDQILYILACERLKLNNNLSALVGVVGTQMSNLGLEQALTERGMEFVRSKVGDRYVLEKLFEKEWLLGGETSGHIISLDYTSTGDGILTALLVIAIMENTGLSLNDLVKGFHKYPQIMLNINLASYYNNHNLNNSSDVNSEVVNILNSNEVNKVIKHSEQQLAGRGRVVVRKSGTEPLVRVMVEGERATEIARIAEDIADVIKSMLKN